MFRIIAFSFQDMGRNLSLSGMTVLILVLMLLSVNTLLVVRIITQQSVSGIQEQLDVSIHFNPLAKDESVQETVQYINSLPEVKETSFLTSEETLEQFRKTYEKNPAIAASLGELEANPLGATLIIKTREPADYGVVIKALEIPEYEDIIVAKTFADTQKAIERITAITSQVERFTLMLSSLFALIAFIIIFNTVRVAIYTQRVEISIKKLVGASNWYVRGPYVIESLFFTALSMLIAGLAVYFSLDFLDIHLSSVFGSSDILTNYYRSHILELVAFQFLAVLLLCVLTSSLAMRKYLRV